MKNGTTLQFQTMCHASRIHEWRTKNETEGLHVERLLFNQNKQEKNLTS